jgi:hypothetical protein
MNIIFLAKSRSFKDEEILFVSFDIITASLKKDFISNIYFASLRLCEKQKNARNKQKLPVIKNKYDRKRNSHNYCRFMFQDS